MNLTNFTATCLNQYNLFVGVDGNLQKVEIKSQVKTYGLLVVFVNKVCDFKGIELQIRVCRIVLKLYVLGF